MKEKILVINDDDGIREMCQLILQSKGYETFEACDGAAGLQEAAKRKPDLILLDIMMPVMDGYETCQKLKAMSETKDIPILFFSSLTNPQNKIKGLELGAVDFINNVVDQGELLARVQTHLQIQSLTRSLRDSNLELTKKQKNLDDDLNAAAMIQRSFLLPSTMAIPHVQVASTWVPANLLGGDIFNVIRDGSDKIIFYVVDVSGHDVPSALVTVSVSQYLHQNASSMAFLSASQMMENLDKEYPLERFNRYFTIFYIILDTSTGAISYSSAGHPPAVLLSKSRGLSLLDRGGTIIGLNGAMPFDEGAEKLSDGDKVILFTDGVTEMKNLSGELYGTERLYPLLERIRDRPVADIVEELYASLIAFSEGAVSNDDISILCFEYNGESK